MHCWPMKVDTPRIVLDTNVWISAALSWYGAPEKVVRRVLSEGLPVFTSATFDELQTRLWLPKFDSHLGIDIATPTSALAHPGFCTS